MGLGTFNKMMIKSSQKGKTLIGGIGVSISTATLLAAKLHIPESTIKNFEVIDNDIHCYITEPYNIPSYCFYQSTELTYYWDYDGMVSNIESYAFEQVEKATHYYFPYCLTTNYRTFAAPGWPNVHVENLKMIYIPRCIRIGSSNTLNNWNFWYGSFNNCKAYFHPMMETVYNGGKEPDIARNLGYDPYKFKADIYVDNFTAPDAVNDLHSTDVFDTLIFLEWTEPNSVNSIDSYEIYVDDHLYRTLTDTSIIIQNLTFNQTYKFSVIAIDNFYNRSKPVYQFIKIDGEPLSISIPYYAMKHRWKLDGNGNDDIGDKHADLITGIDWVTGLVNQCAQFNSSSDRLRTPKMESWFFEQTTVTMLIRTTSLGARQTILQHGNLSYAYRYWGALNIEKAGLIRFYWGIGNNNFSTLSTATGTITINEWHHIALAKDTVNKIIKIYIDGIKEASVVPPVISNSDYGDGLYIGKGYAGHIIGKQDDVIVFDQILTDKEILYEAQQQLAGVEI